MANQVVESLKREVELLRKILAERSKEPIDQPETGCGDNSCLVAKSSGMSTNGGCSCNERTLRRSLQWWKRRCAFLEETIVTLKKNSEI